ncbi:BRISC and BRCA1-A complex member 2 [Hyalella azteca]|uniref:BRISC and BRCA1-A complex member 2 n=1 Tax=Hyalella azteca TaxID=294128 RepID=A0A8B7NT02_HYAAZ|nr:BRISC and BRCA1-A complex member 2 [Hyalella azteca]
MRMPSTAPISIKSLSSKSEEKYHHQCMFMIHNQLPGLYCGYASTHDVNGEHSLDKELCNASMQALTAVGLHGQSNENISDIKFCLFYVGRPFPVRLLFSTRQPWMPPDILCDDNNFMDAITLELMEDHLVSLKSWQEGRQECVHQLLTELHGLYHQYQLSLLDANDPLLKEQYKEFLEELQLNSSDVEVSCVEGVSVLCARLPIDFNDLPAPLFSENCGATRCVLKLTSNTGSNQYEPSLSVSARAESLLFDDSGDVLILPAIPANCTSLVAYASSVIQLINDVIKRVLHSYEIRKQIVAELLCKYDAAISHYDSVRFKNVQLLLDEEGFHYIVDIHFPHGFPQKCSARVYLRSISQDDNDKPVSAPVPNMNHIGELDPDELLRQIMSASIAFAPTFRRQHCHRVPS